MTGLAELHDQVHQWTSWIGVANVRRLFEKVGNRDISDECTVQRSLPWAKIYVDIYFDLSNGDVSDGDSLRFNTHAFSLNSFWTCRFTRRSINGFKIICSRRSWYSFSLLPLFSAAFSMSFENHSLNSSWESKRLGMMKCKRAQSSSIVPLYLARKAYMYCQELTLHGILNRCAGEKESISTLKT